MPRMFPLKPSNKTFLVNFLECQKSIFSIYNSKNLITDLDLLTKICGLVLKVSKENNHFLSSTSNKTLQKKIFQLCYVSPLSIFNNNNLLSFNQELICSNGFYLYLRQLINYTSNNFRTLKCKNLFALVHKNISTALQNVCSQQQKKKKSCKNSTIYLRILQSSFVRIFFLTFLHTF